jgi:hypothetical protein
VNVTMTTDDVRARLLALAEDRATGRLHVRAVAGGWIHTVDGRISGAERQGRPTLLVAMAEAGLFSPDEWSTALRVPFASRWTTLVGRDPERLEGLANFARAFLGENIGPLVDPARTGLVQLSFSPAVTHPFGLLASWTVEEVLADLPPAAPHRDQPPIDRTEFLELLEEVSPHVRRVPSAAFAPHAHQAC